MKTTIFLLSFIILFSCSKKKSDPKPSPINSTIRPTPNELQETLLKLTVVDTLGKPVPYADIILYSSVEDQNDTLPSNIHKADSNGILIQVVEPTRYYWKVSSGCLSNLGTSNTSDAGFKENTLNDNTVVIAGTGTVVLNNESEDMYQVFINDANTTIIGGKSSGAFKVKSGIVKVRILQETGYTYFPTDKTYTVKVYCGQKGIVTFP